MQAKGFSQYLRSTRTRCSHLFQTFRIEARTVIGYGRLKLIWTHIKANFQINYSRVNNPNLGPRTGNGYIKVILYPRVNN